MRLLGSSWMKSIKIYSALPCTIEYSAIIRGFESPKGEIPLNKVTNNCDNYRSYYV